MVAPLPAALSSQGVDVSTSFTAPEGAMQMSIAVEIGHDGVPVLSCAWASGVHTCTSCGNCSVPPSGSQLAELLGSRVWMVTDASPLAAGTGRRMRLVWRCD